MSVVGSFLWYTLLKAGALAVVAVGCAVFGQNFAKPD